jgi:hypothetical protein
MAIPTDVLISALTNLMAKEVKANHHMCMLFLFQIHTGDYIDPKIQIQAASMLIT